MVVRRLVMLAALVALPWLGWLVMPATAYADGGPHAYTPNGVYTVKNQNGIQEQFTIGGNNGCTVYHRWASAPNQTPTGGWTSLGGCVIARHGLDVGKNQDGRLEVFAIGTNNAVYHDWQSSAGRGPWSGWWPLDGQAISGPIVLSTFSGSVYTHESVEVCGTDYELWWKYQVVPNGSSGWSAWKPLGYACNRPGGGVYV